MNLESSRTTTKNKWQHEVPDVRKKSFLLWIDRQNALKLFLIGTSCYIGIVVLFSLAEWMFIPNLTLESSSICNFWDLLYFNFISILSIGYGDMAPKGILRGFTILEALVGLVVYSSFISIFIIKVLLPRENTIIFSKYAYFCTSVNSFMIIYLNTTTRKITNLETVWYFKLNEDWKTMQPCKVPFVTTSVQTFYLGFGKSLVEIKEQLHYKDCLRVSLTGNLGMSTYATSIQYDLSDILVIEDRSELSAYEGFYRVDAYLGKDGFADKFHYNPTGAPKLSDLL
jgi:hypothetical protein